MNATGTGIMDAHMLAGLKIDVSSILSDTDTTTEIRWQQPAGRGYSAGAGTVAYTEAVETCNAWLGPVALTEPDAQIGDVEVLIRYEDLDAAPLVNARFRADSIDYAVYAATRGPLDTHYLIRAHRVA